jgi:hypothetical protein
VTPDQATCGAVDHERVAIPQVILRCAVLGQAEFRRKVPPTAPTPQRTKRSISTTNGHSEEGSSVPDQI